MLQFFALSWLILLQDPSPPDEIVIVKINSIHATKGEPTQFEVLGDDGETKVLTSTSTLVQGAMLPQLINNEGLKVEVFPNTCNIRRVQFYTRMKRNDVDGLDGDNYVERLATQRFSYSSVDHVEADLSGYSEDLIVRDAGLQQLLSALFMFTNDAFHANFYVTVVDEEIVSVKVTRSQETKQKQKTPPKKQRR